MLLSKSCGTQSVKDIKKIQTKKELNDTAIKDIRNFFRLKKENKAIKTEYWRYKKSFQTD